MTFISITIIVNIVLIRSALKSQTQADGHTRTSLLKGLHDVTLWLKYHTGRPRALAEACKVLQRTRPKSGSAWGRKHIYAGKQRLNELLTPINAFIAFFAETGKDVEDKNDDMCWSRTVHAAFVRNQNGVLIETSKPKAIGSEAMYAGIRTIVNFQRDVSPLAGRETGRDRKYQKPPRQVLSAAVLGNWSLGRLLSEDWETGFEPSHLGGTADCCRPSHIRTELHNKNTRWSSYGTLPGLFDTDTILRDYSYLVYLFSCESKTQWYFLVREEDAVIS